MKICVVIPAYKVSKTLTNLTAEIGPEVNNIIVVDDKCPESSGMKVKENVSDSRVEVIFRSENGGVGAAVITGYKRALDLGSEIIIKLDGDGQMKPSRIQELIKPIIEGKADYTKGNRFFEVEAIKKMPKLRILGNLFLSFMTKFSSGYWQIFDPNNGFTAISKNTLQSLPLSKIDKGYFFESDMLFRLNLNRSVVQDVYMPSIYENEKSSLRIGKVIFEFPIKHIRNLIKRIIYTYYIREFNLASIELPTALVLATIGSVRAVTAWNLSNQTGQPTPAGTVVLSAVLLLSALQLLLSFINFDSNNYQKSK
jgi:glycosyltransferase involved in cell wall biosynthesis